MWHMGQLVLGLNVAYGSASARAECGIRFS